MKKIRDPVNRKIKNLEGWESMPSEIIRHIFCCDCGLRHSVHLEIWGKRKYSDKEITEIVKKYGLRIAWYWDRDDWGTDARKKLDRYCSKEQKTRKKKKKKT